MSCIQEQPQKECVQMPRKMARSDPRPSVRVTRGAGSGQHLASVLQERRENANIDAGLGFIWRISVQEAKDNQERRLGGRQLAFKPNLQIIRRSRRPLLRGLEQARRSALAHHVPRIAPMGARVLINGTRYYLESIVGAGTGKIVLQYNLPETDISCHRFVALAPDVILAVSSATTEPLLHATRTVPIVFVQVAEPVGAGFVETLARPGGNVTGFMLYEYGISGKWLELLKEIAPGVKRVGFLQNLVAATGTAGEFGAMQAAAPSLGLEVRPINARDAPETERAIAAFARPANGGLIAGGAAAQAVRRDVIIKLAAQHRLPALYLDRAFVADGGLIAFGPDRVDQYRSAAGYVDRILNGEKPADLPVQAPTKYQLAINLKTARALGLEVPPTLLVRADEVIE